MSNTTDFSKTTLDSLNSLFLDGRCPHALLIDGGDAEERLNLAYLAAKMIVCGSENPPCNSCENCRKADGRIHPDIILVEKPDDRKTFAKKDVKDMVAEAYLTPNDSAKKVYILSETQNMTEETQNVLLKVLEEPPVYTAFILTSETANAIIGTVLSRVVRIRLLSNQDNDYSEKAVSVVKNLSKALLSPYEYERLKATAPIDGNKKLTSEVLELLIGFLRDAVSLKSGGKVLLKDFESEAKDLSEKKSLKKLLDMYDVADGLYRSLENNPNYTLLSALLCARL